MPSEDGITAVKGNANDMQDVFDDDHFDLVVCSATLEHDKHFWLSVGEMQRVLKPGGLLIISVPGYVKNPERDQGRATHTYRVHYEFDYYRFSEQAVREVFFDGMSRVRVKPVMFPPRIFGHGYKPRPEPQSPFACVRCGRHGVRPSAAATAHDARPGGSAPVSRWSSSSEPSPTSASGSAAPRPTPRRALKRHHRRLQLAPVGAALAARPRAEAGREGVPPARRPAAARHAPVDPPAAAPRPPTSRYRATPAPPADRKKRMKHFKFTEKRYEELRKQILKAAKRAAHAARAARGRRRRGRRSSRASPRR